MREQQGDAGAFDHYARLVRRLVDVPVGLVSLVEPERQRFVGAVGLPEPYQAARETPLSHSFCQYVVADQRPLIVSDARADQRLADNLAIEDLDVVAYAGWPVTDHTGRVVGSLCAIDSEPREWSREEIETLEDLALACSAELSERARAEDVSLALSSAEHVGEQTRALLALSTALAGTDTLAEVATAVASVSTAKLGCARAGMWLREGELVAQGGHGPLRSAGVQHGGLVDGEVLSFVADGGVDWASASMFAELPLDETNPLGAALLQRTVISFRTRAEQDRRYPHLVNPHQLGEARAFLPLQLGGRAYGTLALVWPGKRSFTEQDRVSMAALASYTAQAVHRAQLLAGRIAAALTLQHAMLTHLPQPDHLTLAARYRPAELSEEVGGDWYDAILTPSGATYVMIGDVEGHDIAAAALMGQVRSMMRMTSWLSESSHVQEPTSPASELVLLDRAMRDLGLDTTATALLCRIEQTEDQRRRGVRALRWSSAGHLPPAVIDPHGRVEYLVSEGSRGQMLGLAPGAPRHDALVEIAPGSTLLLYTDGLVERRGELLDEGLERLRSSLARHAGVPTDVLLDSVLHDLVGPAAQDDVAVLAVQFGAE